MRPRKKRRAGHYAYAVAGSGIPVSHIHKRPTPARVVIAVKKNTTQSEREHTTRKGNPCDLLLTSKFSRFATAANAPAFRRIAIQIYTKNLYNDKIMYKLLYHASICYKTT